MKRYIVFIFTLSLSFGLFTSCRTNPKLLELQTWLSEHSDDEYNRNNFTIKELKNLEVLVLRGNPIPEEEIKRIKGLLPKCTIVC
ncbi:MAG: hypothetical protein ABUK01_05945 [Leptospirales bacterium]